MFALLGMCALAIDVGSWYQQKRSLQSGADAGALAGAACLPVELVAGHHGGRQRVRQERRRRLAQLPVSDHLRHQRLDHRHRHPKPSPSFFAQVFGHSSVTVKATAKATDDATPAAARCPGA